MQQLKLDELNRISAEEFALAKKLPVVLVLDNVRSMLNVGSIFRTADAFAIQELYLCGITGCPPHREIAKTALGAQDTVSWRHFETTEEAIQFLKEDGFLIGAVEQTTSSIPLNTLQVLPEQKVALVLGNEAFGVSEQALALSDFAVEIPQNGTKHSLNVSVAAGIVCWHFAAASL